MGSGTGRVALGLTHYLTTGSYDGLEIVRPAVRWCQRVFRREYPNFRFHHFDLRNGMYNPRGRIDPDAFAFPFDANSFDFAILTSVFTHLPRSTVDHYLAELARVLAPGGRALVTFFLLNADSDARIERGESIIAISHPLDATGARVADANIPELAIGHPEESVLELVSRRDFELAGPIHYGTWCGRSSGATYQDVLVLRQAETNAQQPQRSTSELVAN